jgi:hypothetical protein
MTATSTTKKPNLLNAARKSVAAELNLPVDDWRVTRLSTLVCAYNGIQALLAAGRPGDVDIDELLRLDTQIAQVRDALKLTRPIEIKVTYTDPVDVAAPGEAAIDGLKECRRCGWKPSGSDKVEKCYNCGWRWGDDTSKPWKPVFQAPTPPTPAAPPAPADPTPAPRTRTDDEAEEAKRLARAAENKRLARISNGIDPGPAIPRVNFNLNSDSPSALMRRIERDYS